MLIAGKAEPLRDDLDGKVGMVEHGLGQFQFHGQVIVIGCNPIGFPEEMDTA